MPRPGVPNNPNGLNGVDDPATGTTSAAGLVQRNLQLTNTLRAPAEDAPRRAKRQATKPIAPSAEPAAAPAVAPQPAPAPLPYPVMLAQAWTQVASIPGASPLVQQIAQEAQSGI